MRRRARSLSAPAAPTGQVAPLFGVLLPPQSQVTQYADKVSERITRLDLHAQRLGAGFGIPFTTFVLNPPKRLADAQTALLSAVLSGFLGGEERVSLERIQGKWGLYFTRRPALVGPERPSETVPLRETPLDVRERFLTRSEEFFREYLELCGDRLGRMQESVRTADRAVALLEGLKL